VHAALIGAVPGPGEADELLAGPDVVRLRDVPRIPPEAVSVLSPARRRRSFAEVRRGFAAREDHDPVQAEASRCFSCGACTGCDDCLVYCPEGVLVRAQDQRPEADYDYCKGCGLCAVACPRGVLFTEAV